jgi:hypothetical protein
MKGRLVKKIGVYLFCAALFWALTLPVAAQTTEIAGVAITHDDIQQFLTALNKALQPNDMTVPVIVGFKPSSEMPSYDKLVHYDGIHTTKSGTQAMYIYISKDAKSDAYKDALIAAIALAVIDGGYAGKAWKQVYDVCAARDAQLPADAPDPYLNRHKLGTDLAAFINSK